MGFPSSHNFTKPLVTKKNAEDLSNRGNHWFPSSQKRKAEKDGANGLRECEQWPRQSPGGCAAAGGPPRLHNSFLNLLLHFPVLSQFILPFNSLFNWRNKISCYLFIIEQAELETYSKDILRTSIEVWPIMHCSNFPWYPGILKISKPSKMYFSSPNHWRNWNTSSKIYWLCFFFDAVCSQGPFLVWIHSFAPFWSEFPTRILLLHFRQTIHVFILCLFVCLCNAWSVYVHIFLIFLWFRIFFSPW